MGWLRGRTEDRALTAPEQPNGLLAPLLSTGAPLNVTTSNVLAVSDAYACVRLLADSISSRQPLDQLNPNVFSIGASGHPFTALRKNGADIVAFRRMRHSRGSARRTLAKCDPFGTPSTSHWTGAAIIVQSPRTKTCIVTRPRASTRPMPFSSAG